MRAWPGGTGGYKLGSNYAAGVVPQQQAAALGYQQILWLFGPEHRLTEVGCVSSPPGAVHGFNGKLTIFLSLSTMNLGVSFTRPDGCERFPFPRGVPPDD